MGALAMGVLAPAARPGEVYRSGRKMDIGRKSKSIRDCCVAESSTYRSIRLGFRLLALAAADDYRLDTTFRPAL